MFLAIGCSSVATGGGGGGGGGGVYTGGLMVRGRATVGWGATEPWGVGAIGGGPTVGVSSASKKRPSQHKY